MHKKINQNRISMRKKTVFIILALWGAFTTMAKADNVTIPDITLLAGGTATMSIELNNTEKDYSAFQFYFSLPEGVSVVMENGRMKYELGERLKDTDFSVSTTTTASGNYFVLGYYTVTQPIPEHSGAIITFTLQADEDVATGTVQGQLYDSSFTSTTAEKNVYDCSFNINIIDLVTLDENSTTPPTTASGKNVVVKRTIKANEWSTICLPFAMTEEQTKTAFGEDVEINDFLGCDVSKNDDEEVTAILVKFAPITAMEANHPYVIRVTEPVSEFAIDGVDIEPEEEVSLDRDEQKIRIGKQTFYFYNSFIGTYVANTEVPENTLFISENKFWYSTGSARMKAFRGYFDFYEILSSIEDANAKIGFSFESQEEDSILDSVVSGRNEADVVYSINGILIGKNVPANELPKGVYIRNGKKLVIK